MSYLQRTFTCGALVLVMAGIGCGGSSTKAADSKTATQSSQSTSTTAASAQAPPTELSLTSNAFHGGRLVAPEERAISAHYTCDGAGVSPPMRWSGVPAGTQELVLFVIDFNASQKKRFFDWAVANLNPRAGRIATGRLPVGAVVGRNGFGQSRYTVCPRGHEPHLNGIILYASPTHIPLHAGFDPNALYEKLLRKHLAEAQSGFLYKRA